MGPQLLHQLLSPNPLPAPLLHNPLLLHPALALLLHSRTLLLLLRTMALLLLRVMELLLLRTMALLLLRVMELRTIFADLGEVRAAGTVHSIRTSTLLCPRLLLRGSGSSRPCSLGPSAWSSPWSRPSPSSP